MGKIICDICGTSYPETADQCPICGCAKDMTAEALLGETLEEEITETVQERPKGGRFAASNVRKRKPRHEEYYDEDDDEEEDDEDYEEEDDEEEEEERSNAPLVVLLVIVIVALLAVTGFIFVKYFMPNMMGGEETTAAPTTVATQSVETTEPTVPCTSLVLTSGTEITLEDVGFSWLINVSALPENTTDKITFSTSNESVAVVGEDGTVTAVGEGTAVITITCGTEQLNCNVICDFTPETTVPETTVPETSATEASDPETGAAETTVPETTVPETTAPEADLPDVTISFVKSDVTSRMIGEQFYLKVNPSDLDPTLVTWSSENEGICTVDQEGLVTITGRGTTHVIAEYRGQKIECIVRVI